MSDLKATDPRQAEQGKPELPFFIPWSNVIRNGVIGLVVSLSVFVLLRTNTGLFEIRNVRLITAALLWGFCVLLPIYFPVSTVLGKESRDPTNTELFPLNLFASGTGVLHNAIGEGIAFMITGQLIQGDMLAIGLAVGLIGPFIMSGKIIKILRQPNRSS